MTLALFLLAGIGCNDQPSDNGSGPDEVDDDTEVVVDTDEGPAPAISITGPAEGGGFYFGGGTLTYEVTDWTLDAAGMDGANVPGTGHVHVYIDEVFVADTADTAYRVEGLTAGPHKLRVALAENDHGEFAVDSTVDIGVALPYIGIVSPVDATALVQTSTPMTLSVSDFSLVPPGGEARFGEGYYRITVDGAPYGWGTDPVATEVTRLMPGPRTIGVELVHADGSPIDPPVRDEVTVQVADTAIGVAIDTSALPADGAAWDSATVPLSISTSNFVLDGSSGRYHIYLDDVFYTVGSTPTVSVCNLPAGDHLVEVRLTDGASSEFGPRDRVRLRVSDDRPDVLVTYPGPRWTMKPSFAMTVAVENFTLTAPGGANETDTGFAVVTIDGIEHARGSSESIAITAAPAGDHLFRVELVNRDGTPLTPPSYSEFQLTISDAAP